VLPGGKLLVAGTVGARQGFREKSDFAVARYNANGTLDTTSGTDKKAKGVTITDLGSDGDYVRDMLVQPDGKVVVAGVSSARGYQSYALVRYNVNGTLDTSFGTGGKQVTTLATDVDTAEIALDANGRIVLAGSAGNYPLSGASDFQLARFLPNGQLDASFGAGGVVTTDFTGGIDLTTAVTVLPDGKVVVAGTSEYREIGRYSRVALARYNPDGTLDGTFGQGGTVLATLDEDPTGGSDPSRDFAAFTYAVAVQPDGKLLTAGQGMYRPEFGPNGFLLMRFNVDGSTDLDFGPLGKGGALTPIGSSSAARALALQPDGKAVLAGWADFGGSASDFALARYLGDDPPARPAAAAPNPALVGDTAPRTAGTVAPAAFFWDGSGGGSGPRDRDGWWSWTVAPARPGDRSADPAALDLTLP
jgi:uncharacterized delta-60 repeat protein